MGNIRRKEKDRTINFTTEGEERDVNNKRKAQMGEFASSTITDLRQVMVKI